MVCFTVDNRSSLLLFPKKRKTQYSGLSFFADDGDSCESVVGGDINALSG